MKTYREINTERALSGMPQLALLTAARHFGHVGWTDKARVPHQGVMITVLCPICHAHHRHFGKDFGEKIAAPCHPDLFYVIARPGE